MIKIIGACLTLVACGSIGFTWARVYEKRPGQLIALEAALQQLETEIVYGATPLPLALEQVADKSDRAIAGFFAFTASELQRMDGSTAGEAWDKAIARTFPETALNLSDRHILQRLGSSLGASDREDQAKHLKLARSQLKLAAAQAEAISLKNSTVFKYMGFLGGLLVVLVLY